jgi:hypothetical protein
MSSFVLGGSWWCDQKPGVRRDINVTRKRPNVLGLRQKRKEMARLSGNDKSPPFLEGRLLYTAPVITITGQMGDDGLVVVITNRGADTLT